MNRKGEFVAYYALEEGYSLKLLSSSDMLLMDKDFDSSTVEDRGLCLFGHNPNGSCRGAAKTRKAFGWINKNKKCLIKGGVGAVTGGLLGIPGGIPGAFYGALGAGLTNTFSCY